MRSLIAIGTLVCALVGMPSQAELLSPIFEKSLTVLEQNPHAIRSRQMVFNSEQFFYAGKSSASSVPTHLYFELFEDQMVSATKQRHYVNDQGKVVWLGKVDGDPLSSVNLIVSQQQLTGNVRTEGKVFQIRSQRANRVKVTEFQKNNTLETDVVQPNPQRKGAQAGKGSAAGKTLPLNTNNSQGFSQEPEIKVLVYYTKQALAEHPDLLEQIELEFVDANQAFENSNIDATVSLAHTIEIDESTIDRDGGPFDGMANKVGPFQKAELMRQKYQADLVHLFSSYLRGACGKAYYAAFTDGSVVADFGYGATSAACTGDLTFAHEIGHNLGAAHDRYVETNTDNRSNFGYTNAEHEFHTVMAYGDECYDLGLNWCQQIPHFSNPQVNYQDGVTGIAEPAEDSADNAKMLNYAALSLANFVGVSRPAINSITQGQDGQVSLSWDTIEGASSYQITRSWSFAINDADYGCSLPHYGVEIEVPGDVTEYTDEDVFNGSYYCYTVKANNDSLLDGADSPESFPRLAHAASTPGVALPFIEDLHIEQGATQGQSSLTLPATGYQYQITLIESLTGSPPVVSLQGTANPGQYTLGISEYTSENQTISLLLTATDQTTSKKYYQQFQVFISGFSNSAPTLDTVDNLSLPQQSTTSFQVKIADNGALLEDAFYVYPQAPSLVDREQITTTYLGDNTFQVELSHEGLQLGDFELTLGYSDGELSAEKNISVNVYRTVYNPTQVEDVIWYVTPGQSITRLLPIIDADKNEKLTVELVTEPSLAELEFVLEDKVSYQAPEEFTSDHFSFRVVDEQGSYSPVAQITIKPLPEHKLSAKQTFFNNYENAYFLSHTGSLYVWGRNDSGELGLGTDYDNQEFVQQPVKVAGNDWADVGVGHSEMWAIKKDGTLWRSGYEFFQRTSTNVFTQVGTDRDWRSVEVMDSSAMALFTKYDGSVWAKGFNSSGELSERPELGEEIRTIEQILPLYGVTQLLHNTGTGFAFKDNSEVWTWGSNRLSLLGREESAGFVAPMDFTGPIDKLNIQTFSAILLSDNQLFFWGSGTTQLLLGKTGPFLKPVQLSQDSWLDVSLGSQHMLGVKQDGSLWSWGGYTSINGEPHPNGFLARGDFPDRNIAQVGEKTNWLKVWAMDDVTAVFVYRKIVLER